MLCLLNITGLVKTAVFEAKKLKNENGLTKIAMRAKGAIFMKSFLKIEICKIIKNYSARNKG